MSWSPQQEAALKAAREWLRSRDTQIFRLFGYAGTPRGYRAGGVLHITKEAGEPDAFDATLVGRNDTRQHQNCIMRRRLGFANDSERPLLGETFVCLRNDYTVHDPVFNGSVWQAVRVAPAFEFDDELRVLRLDLKNEYGKTQVCVPAECFSEQRFDPYPNLQQFDFGYALTVHKAQGSEWESVRLFNEAKYFRVHARRWLYTGITRARERLTIVDYSPAETAEALLRAR
jgi:exodeoxyribonuclease V